MFTLPFSRTWRAFGHVPVAVLIGTVLAACGGGGGGGGAASTSESSSSTSGTTTTTGSSTATTSTEQTTTVDPASAKRVNVGYSERRIAFTGEQPGPDEGGIGAARTVCAPSHFNFDDPLVFPGQPGRTHLHVFFGNTAVDANSTPSSILNNGNSTCRGGIVNRSAYWAPAMIDTATGQPVTPDDESFVYYKTGYFGVLDSQVRATPAGFRMIAGDSKSRVAQPRVNEFSCDGRSSSTIPSCSAGSQLRMSITFPQCWDGVNVTSPDHRSHVAYPTEGRGCVDPRYPVAIFEISMQINYTVPAGGTSRWRLSSDIAGTPAGASGHADWINGWEQDIMQIWVTRLINLGFSATGGLGDGRALY